MKNKILILGIAISLSLFSCEKNKDKQGEVEKFSAEEVLRWNEIAFNAFGGATYQDVLMAARINTMVHLAMHDALNAIQPMYERYAFNGQDDSANPIAAAAVAAHEVLVHEIPAKKSFLDSALSASLATVANGAAKDHGIQLGKSVAISIIANRVNDGSVGDIVGIIPPSATPGVYQTVPPFTFAFAPHWQNLKLFGLQTKDQFRSVPPPALTSEAYAAGYNEVKEVGKLNSATRTQEQSFYAKFWYEGSEAGWNRIARVVTVQKKLNLLDAARLFALVDMAISDSYVAGWDSKYHYNFWRPFTAIRGAAIDGNDNTAADVQWESSEITPPVPDYPSTHSALGNAGATVLARILGDNTNFTFTSFTSVPPTATRSFSSFSQAANENADSRVMAGIHFRFSCKAGQALGTNVGNWIVDHHLKPLQK
ncbi:MAG: vanadium-dependent haloperoxidase [Chitinophagaceae bacterium]|nr:vanadium-dependent haloperoxidase [Chitinophagaceae bacterium]